MTASTSRAESATSLAGGGLSFAFYGRCSTEDMQDPRLSRDWQLRLAERTIAGQGSVVTEFFDIGLSRSLPWQRRPQASRLLQEMANPERAFDAVVIGEPQRAFFGNQFGNTWPLFEHHGVALWLPEMGGAFNPRSEAHDLMMNVFGGLSKAERQRVRTRVAAAMEAATVEQGRFLGGRPPYGYRLVANGRHPNPHKAAQGLRLHTLALDPIAAAVVTRIFDLYLDGTGLRTIASRLNLEGVPCPSAHDPLRNTHRAQDGWQPATVRAILTNRRYTGFAEWGKAERVERLLDPNDVAAGNVVKFRRSDPQRVVVSREPAHPVIISAEIFEQVRSRLGSQSNGSEQRQRSPRTTGTPYLLRGRLICGTCGRRLQGNTNHGKTYYRCRANDQTPGASRTEHPTTIYLRESTLVPALDNWITQLFTPERLEESVNALLSAEGPSLAEASQSSVLTARITDGEARLDQYKEALGAGAEPALVVKWINEALHDIALARTELHELGIDTRQRLTADSIRAMVEDLDVVRHRLATADPEKKAALYEALHLRLVYRHDDASVELQ